LPRPSRCTPLALPGRAGGDAAATAVHAAWDAADVWGVSAPLAFTAVLDEKLEGIPVPAGPAMGRVGSGTAPCGRWWWGDLPPVRPVARFQGEALRDAYGLPGPGRSPAGATRQGPPAFARTSPAPGPTRLRLTSPEQHEALGLLRRLGAGGLPPEPAVDDVKRAFRDLARRYHPDRHPDLSADEGARRALLFAQVADAYRVLLAAPRA
jgi:hypothetical protein